MELIQLWQALIFGVFLGIPSKPDRIGPLSSYFNVSS